MFFVLFFNSPYSRPFNLSRFLILAPITRKNQANQEKLGQHVIHHTSRVTCHVSPVTCHLTTTLCSFSCCESPWMLGDATEGGLVIAKVTKI